VLARLSAGVGLGGTYAQYSVSGTGMKLSHSVLRYSRESQKTPHLKKSSSAACCVAAHECTSSKWLCR